jgi:hypothetical protein
MASNPPKAKTGISKPIMGLPLYAWLAGGAALLVGFLYLKSRGSTASSTTSGVTPAQNTAGTTGYGIPVPVPYSSTTGSTTTQSSQVQAAVLGPNPGGSNTGIWQNSVATYNAPTQNTSQGYSTLPFGTYELAGSPVTSGQNTFYPIFGPSGQEVWALGENVQSLIPWTGTQSSAVGSATQAA